MVQARDEHVQVEHLGEHVVIDDDQERSAAVFHGVLALRNVELYGERDLLDGQTD